VKKFPEMKPMADAYLRNLKYRSDGIVLPETTETSRPVIAAEEAAEGNAVEDEAGNPEELLITADVGDIELLPKPRQLIAELHEHQVQGISWMVHMFQKGMSMILGDQMGSYFYQ